MDSRLFLGTLCTSTALRWRVLFGQWRHDSKFGHGFLVPIFSGLVVWNNRARLAVLPVKPSWAGLAVVVFSLVMLGGVLGAELFLARASLLFLLAEPGDALAGPSFFRAWLFPWVCWS